MSKIRIVLNKKLFFKEYELVNCKELCKPERYIDNSASEYVRIIAELRKKGFAVIIDNAEIAQYRYSTAFFVDQTQRSEKCMRKYNKWIADIIRPFYTHFIAWYGSEE